MFVHLSIQNIEECQDGPFPKKIMWTLRVEIITKKLTLIHTITEPWSIPFKEWRNLCEGVKEVDTEKLIFKNGRYILNIPYFDSRGCDTVSNTLAIRNSEKNLSQSSNRL
jgi:hypothetical protein